MKTKLLLWKQMCIQINEIKTKPPKHSSIFYQGYMNIIDVVTAISKWSLKKL